MTIRVKVACCLIAIGTIIGVNTYLVQAGQTRLRRAVQRLEALAEHERPGAQQALDAARELEGALRAIDEQTPPARAEADRGDRLSVRLAGRLMERIEAGLLPSLAGVPGAEQPDADDQKSTAQSAEKALARLTELKGPWNEFVRLSASRPPDAVALLRRQILPLLRNDLLPACAELAAHAQQAEARHSARLHELLATFTRRVVVTGIFSLLAILATGIYLLRSVAAPLRKLVGTAEAVAAGRFETRALVGYDAGDEFEALARSLNHMLDRLASGTVRHDELERLVAERSREVAQSEARFRQLFHASPVAASLSDFATGEFLDVNDKFCELCGRPRARLIGHASEALGLWRDPAVTREKLRAALAATGRFAGAETVFGRGDGSVFHVNLSAELLRLGDRQVVLAGFLDITARKEAEEKVRALNTNLERLVAERTGSLVRSENQLRLVWEGALDGMRLTDEAGTAVRVNDAYCRLMGQARAALEGRPMCEPYAADRHADILAKHRRRFHERQVPVLVETAVTLRDGSVRQLEIASGFVASPGEPELLFSVFRDITERKRVETALRASEERFHLVNRATFDVIWDQDLVSERIWWSEHLETRYGHRPADAGANGDFWRSCIHPDDRERVTTGVWRALASRDETWSETYRFRRKNGTYAFVADRSLIVRDATGRALRLLGVMQDVTEQKSTEEALRQSKERFQAVFERSPIIIGLLTVPEGRMVEINFAGLAAFGYTREEAVGRTSVELNLWADPADRDRYLAELRAHGHVAGFEAQMRRKNGEFFTVLYNGSIIEIAGQTYSLNSLHDITERRRAEAASRERESLFRGVFDASPIPILLSQVPDGRLLEANAVSLAAFGFSREEVVGRTTEELGLWARPEQRMEFFRRIAAEKSVETFEAVMRTKTGAERIMLCNGTVLHLGGRTCLLTSAVEITAVRRAETEKSRLQEKLFQNQKYEALGTLAGGVAHDFNNILTGIINYTALARSDCPPGSPQIRDYLGEVLKCSNRAKELVHQILLFSRSEDAERAPVPFQPLIREALSLLRATLPATVEIKSDLEGCAPIVLANATQIHQVVMNLGINAAQAMEAHGGVLTVRLRQQTVDPAGAAELAALRPGLHACLELTDTGAGIEPAVLARIFEPFFTTKKIGEGTGLGLAVVHSVVRRHQGAIKVRSQPGAGTTFELFFPVLVIGATTEAAAPAALPRGRGQRILLIDDEAMVAKSLQLMLDRLGYRVTAFTNPELALAHFGAAPGDFDLLIADYQLPGLTGVALAKKILALRPELPVFIASGFAGSMTAEKMHAEGITGFLQKPIDLKALTKTLAATFG
ncbi:MAG: PAS domain S-box protein [Opitutae bacterium]|nr:PAS domain S-box protein [Opitutae bacterium]